jgi:hypothetical protein
VQQTSTSTIVQYVREGDHVSAYRVERSWSGERMNMCIWPIAIESLRRDPMPSIPPGPLGYGRADLLAAGVIKPALHTLDGLPFLSLNP